MKVLQCSLVLVLVAGFALAFQPAANAQEGDGYYTCAQYAALISRDYSAYTGSSNGTYADFEAATYTFTFTNIDSEGATVRLVADSDGATTLAGPISVPGVLSYAMPATGQPDGLGFYFDSGNEGPVHVEVTCGYPQTSPVPGCDTLINIPSQAVSGAFVQDAELYWAPGKKIEPETVIKAGNTYLVAGQDSTGQFRKVLIACTWVWVRAETVGPNYDAVWNGTPLPTTVVN